MRAGEARSNIQTFKVAGNGPKSPHHDQAADPRGGGQPGASGRPCARPARREHHGVLQGVQRADPERRRHDHPGRDHGLRGPLLHVHHEDAAGRRADQAGDRDRQGLGRAEPREGRHDPARPGAPDRRDQDAGPERERRRPGDEDHRGHGALDGSGGERDEEKQALPEPARADRPHARVPARRRRSRPSRACSPRSSTRRSRSTSGSASTSATPTSRCAARWCSRTASART